MGIMVTNSNYNIHLNYDKRYDRYILRWRVPGGKVYHSKRLPPNITRERAERYRLEYDYSFSNVAWRQWCRIDIDTHCGKVQGSTLERLETVYRIFTDICQPLFLHDVDYNMLLKFRSQRVKAGRKPGTINTDLAFLKAAFERAITMGYLDNNPATPPAGQKDCLFARVPEKPVRVIPFEHYQLLMKTAPTDDLRYVIAIGYWAGLRASEILAAQTFDVNYEDMVFSVLNSRNHTTKTGKSRQITITPMLKKYLDHRIADGGLGNIVRSLSLRENGSCSRSVDNMGRAFKRICQDAGLVDYYGVHIYTMHSLRKSCITRWIRAGFAVDEVMEMAGHSDIKTTLKYYTKSSTVQDVRRKMEDYSIKEYDLDDGSMI